MAQSYALLAAVATAVLMAACVPPMPAETPPDAVAASEAADGAELADTEPAAAPPSTGLAGPGELFPAIGPSVLQPIFF